VNKKSQSIKDKRKTKGKPNPLFFYYDRPEAEPNFFQEGDFKKDKCPKKN
jgi:hypothetical protein